MGCGLAWDVSSFIVARFLGGVGIGVSTVAAPLYISEIAPPAYRGRLAGMFQFNIGFGIIVAFVSNYLLENVGEDAWRWMLGVAVFPSLLYAALCLFIPESPRWLLSTKQDREAGIKVGDTITKLNGETVRNPNDLARHVARLSPGQRANITVIRDGKEEVIAATIAAMPSDKQITNFQSPDDRPTRKVGLTLEPAPDGKGVRIAAVKPDSPAAAKGLKPGDVILKVGGADINEPAAMKSALEKAAKGGQESVLLLVRSGDRQRFVALPASSVG